MSHQPASATQEAAPLGKGAWIALALALIVLSALVAQGLMQRRHASAALARWTDERAIPSVALVSPHLAAGERVFTLPGRVAAFYDAAIHAQVSGYIKEWRKDIGAVVKKGDVLAVIDTPELDQRIAMAQEEVSRAKAAKSLADVTAQRWSSLRSTSAVSQQASDEKDSDARVKSADVGASGAKLERLLAQKAFAEIVAPFDGVITARNIDIGALVTVAGENPPLFRIADTHAVRIYVSAPQSYAADLHKGVKAMMTLAQHPGRDFEATIATTANAIETKSRTLLVELDSPNPDGALLPGAYADLRFALPRRGAELRVPASAVCFDKGGVRVATVADGRVRFKTIEIGLDLGAEIEVASGLAPDDQLVDNPGDALADGDEVRVGGPATDPERPLSTERKI